MVSGTGRGGGSSGRGRGRGDAFGSGGGGGGFGTGGGYGTLMNTDHRQIILPFFFFLPWTNRIITIVNHVIWFFIRDFFFVFLVAASRRYGKYGK